MAAKMFDGKDFARKKELELAEKVKRLDRVPKLVSIVVGEDRASHLYVNLKGEAAKRVGIQFKKIEFKVKSEKLKVEEIINIINKLNGDDLVTGIMVQMPLPQDIRDKTFDIVSAIAPEKDVDGLTGRGRFLARRTGLGRLTFLPATVKAVLKILEAEKVAVAGKPVVVVGRSRILGRPLAEELRRLGAKVTVAHSQTPDLGAVTRTAEILVSATGKPGLVTRDMVKPGAVVIDVGEPRGDVNEGVQEVASFVTPVPGGVGPVTVACLIENVVDAAGSGV